MPRSLEMDAFTDRVLRIIDCIKLMHPTYDTEKQIAEFLNKYQYTTESVISKWRAKSMYPTIQHVLLLNKYFKEYGATGVYLVEGKKKSS